MESFTRLKRYERALQGLLILPLFIVAVPGRASHLPITNVAIDHSDSFFVLEDGSLWVSGYNQNGKHGDGSREPKSFAKKVLDDGVEVAVLGIDHSLILKSDGSLWGAGSNRHGQLGLGESTWSELEFVEIFSSGVVSIEAKWSQSFFIKDDGSLWGMGDTGMGQLGLGMVNQILEPTQITASGVVDVATGVSHTLILMNDGSLWAMGDNSFFQLGDAITQRAYEPVKVVNSDVIGIAAGKNHSVILKSDGSAWTAGTNEEGELGDQNVGTHAIFTQVATDVESVHAGTENTIVIKPMARFGDTGGPDNFNLVFPSGAIDIASNYSSPDFASTIVRTSDGELWGLGYNSPLIFGGVYPGNFFSSPTLLSIPPAPAVFAGPDVILVDRDESGFESTVLDGSDSIGISESSLIWLWQWEGGSASTPIASASFPLGQTEVTLTITDNFGHSSVDTLNVTVARAPANPNAPASIVKAATGGDNVMVVLSDGSLWGRGRNQDGSLGNGSTKSVPYWHRLFLTGVQDVSLSTHSLILIEDGSLYTVGRIDDSELGDGTTERSHELILIVESGVSKIDTQGDSSLILMDDGSVWAIGNHLGNGDPSTLLEPAQLYDSDVVDINVSSINYFIVKSNGSAWGSGSSTHGTLGDLSGTQLEVLIFESGIKSISGGTTHSLFLTDQGALWGLGRSRRGELGLDEPFQKFYEPLTIFPDNVAKIEAYVQSSYAVMEDGSLWVAGRNFYGELGTGNTQTVYEFARVIDSGVESVSAASNALVLKDDDSLWAMGYNQDGQLSNVEQLGTRILRATLIAGHDKANAGPDLILKDDDNDGSEEVLLNAYNSSSPWNIASSEWNWTSGSAEGNRVLVSVDVGTNPITLSTTSVDGKQSFDTVDITVLPNADPSGAYYQWLLSHFSTEDIDSWPEGIFFSDPDLDKLTNLDEWILDFDPADLQSGIEIVFLPDLEYNILELKLVSEKFDYRLWSSSDLKNWIQIDAVLSETVGDTLRLTIDSSAGPYVRASLAPISAEL